MTTEEYVVDRLQKTEKELEQIKFLLEPILKDVKIERGVLGTVHLSLDIWQNEKKDLFHSLLALMVTYGQVPPIETETKNGFKIVKRNNHKRNN